MTLTKPFTPTEHYARQVLRAWYDHDLPTFRFVLQQSPSLGLAPFSFVEQERLDLIQDLADGLVTWNGSRQQEDAGALNAALALLRQLARWDDRPDDSDRH